MQQLDAGNRDRCMSVVLQSRHRPQTSFHSAVILLDDIVVILARADRDNPQSSIFGPKLTNGPMRGLVSVEGDRAQHSSVCLEGLAKKGFGGGHVALGAEAKVDGLTAGIHGAIQVDPAPTNLDVRLIQPPRAADRRAKRFQRFSNSRSLVLDPAQNGARRDGNPALGHHLGEIPVRELVAEIPTDTQAACSPGRPFTRDRRTSASMRGCNRTLRRAREGKVRVLGPNRLGVMCPPTGLNASCASVVARPS